MRKIFAQIVFEGCHRCLRSSTALTACGGGDESAAVSVAKDENGGAGVLCPS